MEADKIMWQASPADKGNSRLNAFRSWLSEQRGLDIGTTYEELWQWSVDNVSLFWQCVWDFFEIQSEAPYDSVVDGEMPHAKWFGGSALNLAEHVFRKANADYPAILFQSERQALQEISWEELEDCVARLRTYLVSHGIGQGDRIGAFMPNIPEATYGFLASCSIGAIWSSCSPDFGADSVVDRFRQIEPTILIAVDGYQYGGKGFDRMEVVEEIARQIPSIEKVILIPYLNPEPVISNALPVEMWEEVMSRLPNPMEFTHVPFDHPIWVLYSSGTTGVPKAITHSQGGILIEHLKYLAFHNDVHHGEKFFWFSTTGWMMWNYVQGALMHGATVVLYDGSPAYPDLGVLWQMAADCQLEHFGTSAPYLVACMKEGLVPKDTYDLSNLRTVSSTGAPLPAEAFDWVYASIGDQIWLCSMSGGTDVCTAFVGGCIEKPVVRGEIQCRALGCKLEAFNDDGEPVIGSLGEMVISEPMPSMPVYFWNDPEFKRYTESYFSNFPGIWRHGDWVKLSPEGGLTIYGRSDATLNRQGVRMGTAEIYRALNTIDVIADSLIVHIDHDSQDYMPLFVVMKEGVDLDEAMEKLIKTTLRKQCSPRHVPDKIMAIREIPYTISGKKMEAPVKKILSGHSAEKVLNKDAMRNPEAMEFFVELASDYK